jgi:hypothetical protein
MHGIDAINARFFGRFDSDFDQMGSNREFVHPFAKYPFGFLGAGLMG